MALREEVEAHWAQVESTMKVLAAEAAYDENGDPVKKTAEEFAGLAVRSVAAIGWLWADGYRVMRENYGEIEGLVAQPSPGVDPPKEIAIQRAVDVLVERGEDDDALRVLLAQAITQWQQGQGT